MKTKTVSENNMDKLKEKFKEIVRKVYYGNDNPETACTELTKEIAVKFAEWIILDGWQYDDTENQWCKEIKWRTTPELFTLFLEQKFKPQE